MRTTTLPALLLVLAGAAHAQQAPASPESVARRFYDAFCSGDAATLERLYHPNVKFRDPIFSFDDRAGTMGMWRQLTSKESGGKFSYTFLDAEGEVARVKWVADYALLGRPIHNEITARLVVRDGLIVEHTDDFSWAAWSSQAFPLGPVSNWWPVRPILKFGIRSVLAYRVSQAEKQAPAQKGISDRLGAR